MENKVKNLLERKLTAINVGLYDFSESLKAQGIETIHVNWSPPAGGDQELIDLLDQLL